MLTWQITLADEDMANIPIEIVFVNKIKPLGRPPKLRDTSVFWIMPHLSLCVMESERIVPCDEA